MSSARRLPRVAVDTNLVVSGTAFFGGPYRLLEAWPAGFFALIISNEQRGELGDVLNRPHIAERLRATDERASEVLAVIDAIAEPVVPLAQLPLAIRDPKDEPILAAALGGQADYLVTGDKDLLVLAGDPRLGMLRIVTAAEFLAVLEQEGA